MKTKTTPPPRLSNPHPGRILRRHFLEPLSISQAALASATGLPPSRITELVKERRGITVDSAIRLARVLGPHPQFWLGLQAQFELEEAEQALGKEYAALEPYPVPTIAEAA